MNNKIIAFFCFGCIALMILTACTKSREQSGRAKEETDLSNITLAQVYVATVGASRNFVYMDDVPVTGAALSLGGLFPSSGHAFAITPGLHSFTIRDTLRTSTQVPLTFAGNLQVGKNYTIFTYDTITSPKQVTVLTEIYVPTGTPTARVRFANFIYNAFAVPAVDIFSVKANANLFTNIPTNQVTPFISVLSGVTDTLFVRQTGTTTQLAALNGFTPTNKRSYTLVYRGSFRGTRTLSTFANY